MQDRHTVRQQAGDACASVGTRLRPLQSRTLGLLVDFIHYPLLGDWEKRVAVWQASEWSRQIFAGRITARRKKYKRTLHDEGVTHAAWQKKTFSCPCEHLRVVISYQNIKRFPSYLVHLVAMDTKLIHLLFLFHLLHTHSSPELRAVLQHILTCQSWKSTAEIYNNNDNSCFSFRWAISRRLVVCMLHLLTRLTGSSNRVEPSLN